MDVAVTGSDRCDVELTSDEATTLLVEALADRGLSFDGNIRARLSIVREHTETNDGPLLFRLAMRRDAPPTLPVETPNAAPEPTDSAPDPTADPAPDAAAAGTDL